MKLTKTESEELTKLRAKYDIVDRIWQQIVIYENDPRGKFYGALTEAVGAISDDLKLIARGESAMAKILSNDKDDKIYERVLALAKGSGEIFKGLEAGANLLTPDQNSTTSGFKKKEGSQVAL